MKCLVFLSLFAVAFAITNHGLSEITNSGTAVVAVTSDFPDARVAPVLTTLIVSPTTYDSSAATLATLTVSGTATHTGNNTIATVVVVFSNGGNDPHTFGLGVTQVTGGVTFSGSTTVVFRTTGTYSVQSLTVGTALFASYVLTTATMPTIAVTGYTVYPTATAVSITSPQTGGCDNAGCTGYLDANVTVAPAAGAKIVQLYFRSPVAASSAWFSTGAVSSTTTGVATFTGSATLTGAIGGFIAGALAISTTLPNALLPINQAMPMSATLTEGTVGNYKSTYYGESVIGGLHSAVTFSVGTSDVTAPTCSAVAVTPATIHTYGQGNGFQSFTTTATCVDETGGSGLLEYGVIANVAVTGGSTTTVTLPTTAAQFVPNYVSGSVTVIGVYAVDNAGNTALYGSCGNLVSSRLAYVCGGGGSSSASSVAASLLLIIGLVLALLA